MSYPHIENAQSYEDLHHNCEKFIELRERDKGTGTSYGYQCQFCGSFRGGEVSKKKFANKPSWYDKNIENAYLLKIRSFSSERTSQIEPTVGYTAPELIDHLSELEAVIDNFLEENNLNKNQVLKDFLRKQRERYIKDKFESKWQSEPQLQEWFEENFSEHFDIYREVRGNGFINRLRRNVRIDFVLKAKPKLIAHGFTEQFIGVEVKYFCPKEGKGFHGKSSSGVFQALSYWYSGARWSLPNNDEAELATVLMFSNLSFHDESNSLFNTFDSHYQKVWKAYLSIANHANVGELIVRTYAGKLYFWGMEFNGAKYYSMNKDGEYIKGNQNVINKIRIGNSKC